MRETFFQLCVIGTIVLLSVTLCINFVSASGIYGDIGTVTTSIDNDENSTDILLGMIQLSSEGATITSMGLWSIILAAAGGVTILLGILTGGNTQIMGAWIFSAVFWSSWIVLMNLINIESWIPIGMIVIFTAIAIPIFIGGVIGIFSGVG